MKNNAQCNRTKSSNDISENHGCFSKVVENNFQNFKKSLKFILASFIFLRFKSYVKNKDRSSFLKIYLLRVVIIRNELIDKKKRKLKRY